MDTISCSFNIMRWQATSSMLADDAAWRAWAQGALDPAALPEYKPDLAFLPAMQRRRMGGLARLMFAAAWPLLAEDAHCPLVLVSHDGEINRGFELWFNLCKHNDVSPTSFGLSVHNALAGQWSMLRGDMSEHTALTVRDAALETGLLEACALLQEDAAQVLMVIADEPLAAQYSVRGALRPPFAHALALLLEAGDGWQIRREHTETAQDTAWSALSFIRAQYLGKTQWRQDYARCRWHWQKRP